MAGLCVSRWVCNFSLRSSKLAFCILREGKEVARDIERLREVMMGRWSALGGWMLGLMLQEMIGFEGLFERHFESRDTGREGHLHVVFL